MSVLVRKVLSRYWNEDDIDSISIKSITYDWGSNDKDWSVYKVNFIDSYGKNNNTNNVVLRLLASNPKKCTFGVDLFILEDDFYNDFIVRDCYKEDQEVFGTVHVNLKNIDYSNLTNVLQYSLAHKDNIITYTMEDIRNLLIEIKLNGKIQNFADFIYQINDNEKKDINQTFGNIQKNFF